MFTDPNASYHMYFLLVYIPFILFLSHLRFPVRTDGLRIAWSPSAILPDRRWLRRDRHRAWPPADRPRIGHFRDRRRRRPPGPASPGNSPVTACRTANTGTISGMTAAPAYDNSVRVGSARASVQVQEHQAQLDALAAAHCRGSSWRHRVPAATGRNYARRWASCRPATRP
jgi:hypothetical protein